jgi:enterochelin esterase-like enzyme
VGPEGNEQSILGTRGWVEPRHLDEPTGPRGSLEELTWTSAILDNERVVKVYLPPGYAEGAERYPLLVVHLGDQALALGQMDRALDNLIGEQMEPVVVACVGRLRWEEFAGSEPDRYVQALTEELIPRLESQYRLEADGASRGVMGVGSGAFVSMFATFTRPGLFGRVGTQSFYLGDRGDELLAAMDEADASGLRAFVQWSHNDYRDERAGLDAAAQSQQIVELMRQRGGEPMTLEVGDGPGWMEWSARWNKLLPSLYPAE